MPVESAGVTLTHAEAARVFGTTGNGRLPQSLDPTETVYARHKWRSILPAGLVLGLMSPLVIAALKFGYFLVAFSAGSVAVLVFRSRSKIAQVRTRHAFRLGALTGLASFIVTGVWMAISVVMVLRSGELKSQVMQGLQQAAGSNPDAQTRALIAQVTSPEGLVALATVTMFVMFFGVLFSCALGGVVAAKIFRKEER